MITFLLFLILTVLFPPSLIITIPILLIVGVCKFFSSANKKE